MDTRIIYCGDCLDQLRKLPDGCVDLITIDPPFNSNRNYEVFWGETKEKRAFEDRHASTAAYIDYMRPRCGERYAYGIPLADLCKLDSGGIILKVSWSNTCQISLFSRRTGRPT